MARKRDYAAEYKRRQELARKRGFKSYAQQRRAIERGTFKSLAPGRLKRKDVIERQVAKFDIFAERDWFASFDVTDARIDMAQKWSDWYSQHWSTKFDAERARNDPHYLDVYMQSFVLVAQDRESSHRFTWDEYRREWFTDIMGYLDVDQYDDRYKDS